jgi:hypothetical protein
MPGFPTPVVWLIRHLTGYRPRHLLVVACALVAELAALAVPFWWLGQQADAAFGPTGYPVVAALYICAAVAVVAFSLALVLRLVVGRLRRRFA